MSRASTTRPASTAVRRVRGHRLGSQRSAAWATRAPRQPATASERSRGLRSSQGVSVATAMIPSAITRPTTIAAWRSSSAYQSRRPRAPASEVQRKEWVLGMPLTRPFPGAR